MSDPQAKTVRPLYFIASYPRSGSNWVRSVVFLLAAMRSAPKGGTIDLRNVDNIIPWDVHGALYEKATGQNPGQMSEAQVAAARADVHRLLATDFKGLPVVRTHAIRGTFHGHPTINPQVTRGAAYIVRNPLDVASALIEETGTPPLKIIEMMMKVDRRVRPHKIAVTEPQGSWSQNVASWTGRQEKAILVLKFEDIAKNPTHQFRKLADHMRLPITEDTLGQSVKLIEAQRKKAGRLGLARDYRKTLQPIHARAIVEGHAVEMNRLGYLTPAILDYVGLTKEHALEIGARHAPRAAQ
ncbi:sulfotransferase domain-containing protein [Pelagibacterium xiamenense]|uniref:sulfotransferase domain-containing protein n=1 Tax=Pelagibacterium xiamenense TaxID=2901140 RepID=UPI001E3D0B16|nr:sulfotransferase domain-containing protein [Pelagibacterium xiamenense]